MLDQTFVDQTHTKTHGHHKSANTDRTVIFRPGLNLHQESEVASTRMTLASTISPLNQPVIFIMIESLCQCLQSLTMDQAAIAHCGQVMAVHTTGINPAKLSAVAACVAVGRKKDE